MFYLEEYDMVIPDANTVGEGMENGQDGTSRTHLEIQSNGAGG